MVFFHGESEEAASWPVRFGVHTGSRLTRSGLRAESISPQPRPGSNVLPLAPPVANPFLTRFCFFWEGSHTNIDYRKDGTLFPSSLLADLYKDFLRIANGLFGRIGFVEDTPFGFPDGCVVPEATHGYPLHLGPEVQEDSSRIVGSDRRLLGCTSG